MKQMQNDESDRDAWHYCSGNDDHNTDLHHALQHAYVTCGYLIATWPLSRVQWHVYIVYSPSCRTHLSDCGNTLIPASYRSTAQAFRSLAALSKRHSLILLSTYPAPIVSFSTSRHAVPHHRTLHHAPCSPRLSPKQQRPLPLPLPVRYVSLRYSLPHRHLPNRRRPATERHTAIPADLADTESNAIRC